VLAVGLAPAIALIAGAAFGVGLAPAPVSAGIVAVIAAAAVAAWYLRRPWVTWTALQAGFFCAAAVLAADARDHALRPSLRDALDQAFGGFLLDTRGPEGDHDPIRIRASILEDAAVRDGFVSLRVRSSAVLLSGRWVDAVGGVSMTVNGGAAAFAEEWRAGRLIEAPVSFRRPARYLNEGVPDFERNLALDATALFASAKSALLVEVLAHGDAIHAAAADVRAHVRGAVARWVTPHDAVAGAIVSAVLIGDRTGLPDEIRDRLQAAGTYHVIAISGGNIAILTTLLIGTLALAGVRGRLAAAVAILVLLVYAQVATAGPSVWRATLMAIVYLAARLLDQRSAPWQAASVAAGLMVVVRPLDIRDPGFVLTFGATAALLEGARFGRALLPTYRGLAWIAGSVAASLAVELTLTPVSAQAFSRVTFAGPLLNLIAVPMMGVAQVAGMVVAVATPLDPVASVAGWVAASAAEAIVESARLVDVAPWLTARVQAPGVPLLIVYYAALAGAAYGSRIALRTISGLVLVAALVVVTGLGPRSGQSPLAGTLRLTMFDVGQGDAILLENDAGTLLVDTGGAPFGTGGFDIGERVLAPALWARGVHTLDGLLLTHGDPDHIGGAAAVLQDFDVRSLWEGIEVPRHDPSRALRQLAEVSGIPRSARRAGETIQWGSATIRVLHPPEPDWERPRIRNDDSVVLEVVHGDVALLLTGDVSSEIERAIAGRLTPARTRILKVGHHGSRTSTSQELLDAWRPHVALISAGRGNTFGHPTPEVLGRLEATGTLVYRTDLDGQITLETDGHEVSVRTFTGGTP
jgi:competence protein ComEC